MSSIDRQTDKLRTARRKEFPDINVNPMVLEFPHEAKQRCHKSHYSGQSVNLHIRNLVIPAPQMVLTKIPFDVIHGCRLASAMRDLISCVLAKISFGILHIKIMSTYCIISPWWIVRRRQVSSHYLSRYCPVLCRHVASLGHNMLMVNRQ